MLWPIESMTSQANRLTDIKDFSLSLQTFLQGCRHLFSNIDKFLQLLTASFIFQKHFMITSLLMLSNTYFEKYVTKDSFIHWSPIRLRNQFFINLMLKKLPHLLWPIESMTTSYANRLIDIKYFSLSLQTFLQGCQYLFSNKVRMLFFFFLKG